MTRKIVRAAVPHRRPARRNACAWATSTSAATGAGRPSTSRRCGSCCSSRRPTTTSSPPAAPCRWRTSFEAPSPSSASTGKHHVNTDPTLLRPSDIRYGAGDPGRALRDWAGARTDVDGVIEAHVQRCVGVPREQGLKASCWRRRVVSNSPGHDRQHNVDDCSLMACLSQPGRSAKPGRAVPPPVEHVCASVRAQHESFHL